MPKGGASSLTPVNAGLRDDLDGFLKAFLKLKTVRYSDYKNLFKSFEIQQLFCGRSVSAEIIEFNDYILTYCLPYMEAFVCSSSPRTFEEQIFGLYSLYTFFYLQEVDHVVKIRIDPDTARNFGRLMELALHENVYEAYMCGMKLLQDRAFKYVAFIQVYDPSCFKRFNIDKEVSSMTLRTNLNDPLSGVKELVNSRIFSMLNTVHGEYMKRRKLAGIEDNKGVLVIKDLQNEARGIIAQKEREEMISGVEVIINTDYTIEHLGTRGMLRSEIKEKAYGSDLHLSKFRRHCTTSPLDIKPESFYYQQYDEVEPLPKKRVQFKLPLIQPSPPSSPSPPPPPSPSPPLSKAKVVGKKKTSQKKNKKRSQPVKAEKRSAPMKYTKNNKKVSKKLEIIDLPPEISRKIVETPTHFPDILDSDSESENDMMIDEE